MGFGEFFSNSGALNKSTAQGRFRLADDLLNDVHARCAGFHVTAEEWVVVLRLITADARLRLALPLLKERNPGRRFTHAELATFTGLRRETVLKTLARLRESGEYADEITRRGVSAGCECPPEGHEGSCRFNRLSKMLRGVK